MSYLFIFLCCSLFGGLPVMHIAVWFNAYSIIKKTILFFSTFYGEVLLGWQEILCLIIFPQQFGNEDRIHLTIPKLGGSV